MRINIFYMRVIFAGVAFLLFFTLIVRSVIYNQKKRSDKPAVWKETVGTLNPNGHGEGKIHYQVDDKEYSGTFIMRNENAVLGEKYTMRYNVNNPEEIEIDYWHPVFVSGEQTHPFIATIKKYIRKAC